MMQRIFSSILLFSLLLAMPAAAQTGHTVGGVEVKATAADATTARMQAMEAGEVQAFARLLEQMLPADEAAAKAASTPAHQISRMVRGYEVHNEKIGATSYEATLDVQFDPAQVQAFLRGPQQPPVPGQPVPVPAPPLAAPPPPAADAAALMRRAMSNVLVLPIWSGNRGTPLLWEEANSWRKVWNKAERGDTQFIRLPIGDQSDRMMLDAEQATRTQFADFSPIAERYQSSTVIVASARAGVSSGVNALLVDVRRLSHGGEVSEMPLVYEQNSGETGEDVMARAAQDIIRLVMHEERQRAAQQAQQAQAPAAAAGGAPPQVMQGPVSRLTVLSRLERLNDWVGLRKRLQALPNVERVDLAAISNRQVDMVVHYRGSPAQLEAAMQSQGIRVSKSNNYWVVGF